MDFSLPLRIAALAAAAFLPAPPAFAQSPAPADANALLPVLLESEDIEFKASWRAASDLPGASGNSYLAVVSSDKDALTVIDLAAGGHYDVWTRSADNATDGPGTRRYLVVIDGVKMSVESGQHKMQGWGWEKVGAADLEPGRHVIALRDTAHYWARSDAILLAPSALGFDPKTASAAALQKYRIQPVRATPAPAVGALPEPDPAWKTAREAATLETDAARMVFLQLDGPDGQPRIGRRVFTKAGGEWREVPFDPGAEALFFLFNPEARIDVSSFIPLWHALKPVTIEAQGKSYQVWDSPSPYAAGEVMALHPVAIRQASATEVRIDYSADDGSQASAVWTLRGEVQALQVALTPARAGDCSIGFSPFQGWTRDQVQFVQLPPLFQMRRLPEAPVLLASATMPHALSMLQVASPGGTGSSVYLVAADPRRMPFKWGSPTDSDYGFSLFNAQAQPQGTAFAPILGTKGSRVKAGAVLEAGFTALCAPGDWKLGLKKASEEIFAVTDYREPGEASLTEAALNMIDLLKDADASGWDALLKGNYNIESKGTASQASPLTFLSAALLTRDPAFYAARAVPTIEYTLSRARPHYATAPASYVPAQDIPFVSPAGRAYDAKYWQGAYDLTGRLNPWLKSLALDQDRARQAHPAPGQLIPSWAQALGAYTLDPAPERLAAIRQECDAWIASEVYGRKTQPVGIEPFYNVSFYPYWWDLLDLYELTRDRKYLDAAVEGGFHTVAGIWSHPPAPPGMVTIPADDIKDTKGPERHLYWKGDATFRLGVPRQPGDTVAHQVPAWKVSQVGLGFEQPVTLYHGGGSMRNIMNAAWAPSLLRLYKYTGDEIFKVYARNAVVGRFANYPGYYVTAFTDLMMSPQYPYKGPDITDLYYHHIPVHLAWTLDYLFTEADQLSQGAVAFPWVRQEGYVWFASREYGGAPGKVYGDAEMWPWLDRAAFSVDAPQVDYLGALGVGNGKFDVVAVNATRHDVAATLRLDLDKTGVAAGQPFEFLVNGVVASRGTAAASLPFQLAAGEVGLFRFASTKAGGFAKAALAPLETRPVSIDLPQPWGQLHAMRLRSPFGQDSLYAYLSGPVPAGATATLQCEGSDAPAQTRTTPPYEFSVPSVPMNANAILRLELKNPDGSAVPVAPIPLPGTGEASH